MLRARMLEVGAAKNEITAWEPGLGMMGWGMLDNVVERVATPLHARAFVLVDAERGTKLAIVVCELAFISLALRERVCDRLAADHPELGLALDDVLLTATHTHSGPGGFTHYAFYNVTIPGFCASVLERLADGIVRAIVSAWRARTPGVVRWAEGACAPELEVAFQRSLPSYNSNPDVEPVAVGGEHLAIDRTMRLLRFDAADGRALGSINWFAVHGTSVHSDNTAIHFDNKGYAAQIVERQMADRGHASYVAAFAQGACGDVTPNFWRHPGRPFVRGKFPDDDESARFCGEIQADLALALLDRDGAALPARIARAHAFVDMSAVEVDARYADGRDGLRTSPAEIGMAMFLGTEEGPGLPRQLRRVQTWLLRSQRLWRRGRRDAERDASQGPKIPWVESGRRRILGFARLGMLPALPLPGRLRAALAMVRELERSDDKPWTPQVLPVQLAVVGDVAICALPAELTTVAGRRTCEGVIEALASIGVRRGVLAGYSNAYAGYVTTPEEYALQDYEGASTHFGQWTLPAYQTELARLAARLRGDASAAVRSVRPPAFTAAELAGRSFAAR
jgi:neutral ceramidase